MMLGRGWIVLREARELTAEEAAEAEQNYREWALEEATIAQCPNYGNHLVIRDSGSDDGCLECGFYAK